MNKTTKIEDFCRFIKYKSNLYFTKLGKCSHFPLFRNPLRISKKAMTQTMTWFLLLTMFILIATAYIHVWSETKEFASTTGEIQSELIDSYHQGELALIFTDQAAKYSIQRSIIDVASNGGYIEDQPCNTYPTTDDEYVLWEDFGEQICYPTKSDVRKSISKLFAQEFNNYAIKYTPTKIPKNNYDLMFKENEHILEITGIATQEITIPRDKKQYEEDIWQTLSQSEQECLSKENQVPLTTIGLTVSCGTCPQNSACKDYTKEKYCTIDPCSLKCAWKEDECRSSNVVHKITASFKLETYNIINQIEKHSKKSIEMKERLVICLAKGSEQADDDDLETCSRKESSDITYRKTTNADYTLLFNIEYDSLNIYAEKLAIKYGIRFLDDFPPPQTDIIKETETDGTPKLITHLRWNRNKASDVAKYMIYARQLQPINLNDKDLITTITSDQTEWKIDYTTKLTQDTSYYFYVIAEDNKGNTAAFNSNTVVQLKTKKSPPITI